MKLKVIIIGMMLLSTAFAVTTNTLQEYETNTDYYLLRQTQEMKATTKELSEIRYSSPITEIRNWIDRNIKDPELNQMYWFNTRKLSAKSTFNLRKGTCTERSYLALSMLRTLGYKAKVNIQENCNNWPYDNEFKYKHMYVTVIEQKTEQMLSEENENTEYGTVTYNVWKMEEITEQELNNPNTEVSGAYCKQMELTER